MWGRSESLAPAGRAVIITGASSGLGEACALHLDRLGFRVFAGVRRPADGERLAAKSPGGQLQPLLIDVTDGDSIMLAARTVRDHVGEAGLWGLVNNAGIVIPAPLEWLSSEQLRLQLETNLVGQLAVIRQFVPMLRDQRGRIVNVTSGLGSIAMPFLGAYVTSQFAKEGLSDVLRRELAPQGVAVCVVRCGAIVTPIWEKAAAEGGRICAGAPAETAGLYRDCFLGFLTANEQLARASKTTPADFAGKVADALTAARPKARYAVGRDAASAAIARLLPAAMMDRRLAAITAPRPASSNGQPTPIRSTTPSAKEERHA